jgi:hypothetical protein
MSPLQFPNQWLVDVSGRDILSLMNGVTTAIILFIFAALAVPSLVKHRSQFYAALAIILIVIFLDATARVIHSDAYIAFAYFMCAIGQILAVLLLVLSAGGLSPRQLAGDMGRAFEVIRRGETEKEVIIPLSAAAFKKAHDEDESPSARRREPEEDRPRQSYTLDDVEPPAPAPPKKPDAGSLPLV